MYKIIVVIAVIGFLFYNISDVSAQPDPQLATFQETAQILVDKRVSNNVTASITLQSTSNQEFRIPSILEQIVLDNAASAEEAIELINLNRSLGVNFILSDSNIPCGYAVETTALLTYNGTWDNSIESNPLAFNLK